MPKFVVKFFPLFTGKCLLPLALLITAVSPGIIAQDWPGFHGFERQGNLELAKPDQWPTQLEPGWKSPIPGIGYSSPVVAQDKIYMTSAYLTRADSNARVAVTVITAVLGWVVFIAGMILTFRAAGSDWSGRSVLLNGGRLFLIMSAAFLVLAVSLFSRGLYDLDNSLFRSWKVALVVAFLSLSAFLFVASLRAWTVSVFALAGTLLSVVAYATNPQGETFFDLKTSEGLINTAVILLPAIVTWVTALVWFLVRKPFAQPEHNPWKGFAGASASRMLICSGLPLVLTGGMLWTLVNRMIQSNKSPFQHPGVHDAVARFEPALGWPLFAFSLVFSLALIVLGSVLVLRQPASARGLFATGSLAALLLVASSFASIYAFPAKRQMAYAMVSLDRNSGNIEWLRELGYSAGLSDFKPANSHATPTVGVGSNKLCAYFGSAGLYGVERDGTVAWKVVDAQFYSTFGVGHSPVVADDVIILANDNERRALAEDIDSQIMAYSLNDGKLLWRQKRDRVQFKEGGFCTPLVRTINGRRTILMRGWEDLTAYDLHSGDILWTLRLRHRGNILVAGMVTDDKRVYLIDEVGVRAFTFKSLAEGRVDAEWTVQVPGPKISTPVLVDNLLFGASETGIAFCIDVAEGNLEWREKLGGRYFSSVVVQGNSVVFATESGDVSIVEVDKVYRPVSRTRLGEKLYATPAPQANGLLVRGTTNLHYLKFTTGLKESTLSLN